MATFRSLRGYYGTHNCPTTQASAPLFNKFEDTVSSCIIAFLVPPLILLLQESGAEAQYVSISRRSQKRELSHGILNLDLCLHSYEVQLIQQLKHLQRHTYVVWVLESQSLAVDFPTNRNSHSWDT